MLNSSTCNSKNYYKLAKKVLAGRSEFNKIPSESHLSSLCEQPRIVSITENNHKMRPIYDNKQFEKMEASPAVEGVSLSRGQPSDDGPLDYSLKRSSRSAKESVRHLIKPLENCKIRESNNITTHPGTSAAFPDMVNGNNSSFNVSMHNGSPSNTDSHEVSHGHDSHIASSNKNSESSEVECSRSSSTGSASHKENGKIGLNGNPSCSNFPDYPSSASGNSPENRNFELENFLRQQESILGSFQMSQSLPAVVGNNVNVLRSQNMSSPSPPFPPAGSVIHPGNMPFPAPVYYGCGYVDPRTTGASFLPQFPEPNIADISAAQKQRKKKNDCLREPPKSYSLDEIRKKVESANKEIALMTGQNYPAFLTPVWSPPPSERVKISFHNGSSGSAKGAINHRATNGTSNKPNVPRADDANSSASGTVSKSVKDEMSGDSRKRKSMDDADKDEAYYERRRKNNMAAKRSRENRREKEETVKEAAESFEKLSDLLQQQNSALTFRLHAEGRRYRHLIEEYERLKIQNSILADRLNQKKCGQCGTSLPGVH